MTPEAWGILGSFLVSLGTLAKVLLDQRGKRQDAQLTDAGQRREEWHEQAEKLQTRIDALDTAYKTRIDAMDATHKAEVRELQAAAAKARDDYYEMVKIQLGLTAKQHLLEDTVREMEVVIRRLDEHIIDLYMSIQQEPEAGPRILGRLKTARPAVLLRNIDPAKGEKS